MTATAHTYDVCFSFAGADRDYVRAVASELTNRGIRVFYDEFEEAALWGVDLYEHLADLYENAARFCVMFISHHYAQAVWTTHERRSAQARALREFDSYILPVRFDDTQVPGLRNTLGYIRASGRSPEKLADLIEEKVRTGEVAAGSSSESSIDRASGVKYEELVKALRERLQYLEVVPYAEPDIPGFETFELSGPKLQRLEELAQEFVNRGLSPVEVREEFRRAGVPRGFIDIFGG